MRDVIVYRAPVMEPTRTGWRVVDVAALLWGDHFIVIGPGMETDLASVPRLFRPLIDNDEPGIRLAAIAHDAAYRGDGSITSRRLTRAEADAMLRDVAIARGLPRWKAWLAWAAVRAFGWRWWRKRGSE